MPKIKYQALRSWFVFGIVILVLVSMSAKFGWGSACALGLEQFAYVCPLGWLEAAVAGRAVFPQAAISLVITLVVIVLAGAAFCAWACPTNFVRALAHRTNGSAKKTAAPTGNSTGVGAPAHQRRFALDSRHVVLGGAIVSSALFGFPVFCLICPVGLFFGTLFAVGRLFSIQQAGLELLVFPVVLGLEVLVLKNWCRTLCPLGGLLSLLSGLNPFFRPAVDNARCLRSKGAACQTCYTACPEEIDPREPARARALANCTKCANCVDRCPTHAITLPFLPRPAAIGGSGPRGQEPASAAHIQDTPH